jgi:16S rRNA processing protein RimM
MGQVIAPFGVQGWLRLRVFTEEVDSLAGYDEWWLEAGGAWRAYELEEVAIGGRGLRAKLAEIDDRDAALALSGASIAVPREKMPQGTDDEFYQSDLLGFAVKNLQDEQLGVIASFLDAGANEVLVVKGERERMIPSALIESVDMDERVVIVDWGADY